MRLDGRGPELVGEIEQIGGAGIFDDEEDAVERLREGREADDREGEPDDVADRDAGVKATAPSVPRPSTRATMAAMPGPGEAAAIKRAVEKTTRPARSMVGSCPRPSSRRAT